MKIIFKPDFYIEHSNGIGVISKVSGRLDPMIVRVLWPDSTEIDYSIYTFKENSILLNTDLNKNILKIINYGVRNLILLTQDG